MIFEKFKSKSEVFNSFEGQVFTLPLKLQPNATQNLANIIEIVNSYLDNVGTFRTYIRLEIDF